MEALRFWLPTVVLVLLIVGLLALGLYRSWGFPYPSFLQERHVEQSHDTLAEHLEHGESLVGLKDIRTEETRWGFWADLLWLLIACLIVLWLFNLFWI